MQPLDIWDLFLVAIVWTVVFAVAYFIAASGGDDK